MKLKQIATIHMGYPFRARLERVEGGNIAVVQMKDIDEDNRLDASDLVPVNLENVKDIHLVRRGDLIFRSRGRVNTATLIDKDLGKVITAAPLLRIRAKKDRALPEYLAWYINQPKAQAYIASRAAGTISRMINTKSVGEMEIELPPIERQKHIADIGQLADMEQKLLRRLAEKRKSYIDGILMRLAVSGQLEEPWG